jgi:hypothetical protein
MMTRSTLLLPIAAIALVLTACEARFGNAQEAANESGNVSAEGKAKEGELSIHTPGFDMKINIPEGMRHEITSDDHDDLLYPGATFGGIHVEGGHDNAHGRSQGQVELAYATGDAPDLVARWYQDPARGPDFTVATTNRQGPAIVIAGTRKHDDGDFRVTLTPRAGGGTDGRVLLTDRD